MLEDFVAGRDRSTAFADRIASLLISEPEFQDSELYDDLLVPLDCYRPGGGANLYDERSLALACKDALHMLRMSHVHCELSLTHRYEVDPEAESTADPARLGAIFYPSAADEEC